MATKKEEKRSCTASKKKHLSFPFVILDLSLEKLDQALFLNGKSKITNGK
jgi:hypothetical protein